MLTDESGFGFILGSPDSDTGKINPKSLHLYTNFEYSERDSFRIQDSDSSISILHDICNLYGQKRVHKYSSHLLLCRLAQRYHPLQRVPRNLWNHPHLKRIVKFILFSTAHVHICTYYEYTTPSTSVIYMQVRRRLKRDFSQHFATVLQ